MKAFKEKLLLAYVKITKPLFGFGLGNFPGITFFYTKIYQLLNPNNLRLIKIDNFKMVVNFRDKVIVSDLVRFGYYEKLQTELFYKLLKKNDQVIDIGANIGYYTLIASKLVEDEGKVYAFEPEKMNYSILCKNIQINELKNVKAYNNAVSSNIGDITLYLDKFNLGAHSLNRENVYQLSNITKVKCTTLDQFLKENIGIKSIKLLKIDTQGSEGLIIDGGKYLLKDKVKNIILEFWPSALLRMDFNPIEIILKLQSFGFSLYFINEIRGKLYKLSIKSVEEVCNYSHINKDFQINIFGSKENIFLN